MTSQHTDTGHTGGGTHVHQHAASSGSPDDIMTDLLDLDGEVLHDYWSAALDWVSSAAGGARLLVDLGAGTGTGALGLAERFPAAAVIAVDVQPGALARLRDKAAG